MVRALAPAGKAGWATRRRSGATARALHNTWGLGRKRNSWHPTGFAHSLRPRSYDTVRETAAPRPGVGGRSIPGPGGARWKHRLHPADCQMRCRLPIRHCCRSVTGSKDNSDPGFRSLHPGLYSVAPASRRGPSVNRIKPRVESSEPGVERPSRPATGPQN
jgi:hypothetical protein